MKILSLLAMAVFLAFSAVSAPVFAVDASISAFCRPGADARYSRPGGWCEQIASNKSIAAVGSLGLLSCPAGQHNVPNDGLGCIPE